MKTLREQLEWRTFLLKEAKQPLVNADPVKGHVAAAIATASTRTVLEPELEPPTNVSTRASTGIPRVTSTSVRDRMETAAALRKPEVPLTPAQIAAQRNADEWLALHQRYKAEEAESERRKQRAIADRATAANAAEDRRQRKARLKFAQDGLDNMFASEAATAAEIAAVNARVAANNPTSFGDAEFHQITLWKLRADRG